MPIAGLSASHLSNIYWICTFLHLRDVGGKKRARTSRMACTTPPPCVQLWKCLWAAINQASISQRASLVAFPQSLSPQNRSIVDSWLSSTTCMKSTLRHDNEYSLAFHKNPLAFPLRVCKTCYILSKKRFDIILEIPLQYNGHITNIRYPYI